MSIITFLVSSVLETGMALPIQDLGDVHIFNFSTKIDFSGIPKVPSFNYHDLTTFPSIDFSDVRGSDDLDDMNKMNALGISSSVETCVRVAKSAWRASRYDSRHKTICCRYLTFVDCLQEGSNDHESLVSSFLEFKEKEQCEDYPNFEACNALGVWRIARILVIAIGVGYLIWWASIYVYRLIVPRKSTATPRRIIVDPSLSASSHPLTCSSQPIPMGMQKI